MFFLHPLSVFPKAQCHIGLPYVYAQLFPDGSCFLSARWHSVHAYDIQPVFDILHSVNTILELKHCFYPVS